MFEIPTEPTRLHQFIEEHSIALQHAAFSIGGRPWLRRVQQLLDVLPKEGSLLGHTGKEITALHELLTSKNGTSNSSDGTRHISSIDPKSSVVEEISVLADELWQIFQAEHATQLERGGNAGEGVYV